MTIEGLGFVNSLFESLGIPYEFMQWNSPNVPNTYWVGEYIENESVNEDGLEQASFILTGITNQKFLELETVKQQLKDRIGNEGMTAILESGSAIAVSLADSQPLPSVENGVHRLQITLNVREWRT